MKYSKNLKYGGFTVIVTLAVITGVIILNLIFGQFSPQFDLTANKLFSLSEQSLQVTDSLKSPVKIYGLWETGRGMSNIEEVVAKYTARSHLITLELVDQDKNPGFVMKYDKEGRGIPGGSLVVEGEKGFKLLLPQDMYDIDYSDPQNPQITGFSVERRVTSAILFVSSGETPIVYEITGHEENALGERVEELLGRENTALAQLNLIQSDIPSDASALVLNGPRRDFLPSEAEKLISYLEGGGRLFALMNIQAGHTPNLAGVFESYGLRFEAGIVAEFDKNYNPSIELGALFDVMPDMASHEITAPLLRGRSRPLLGLTRAITRLPARRRSLELTPFLTTSSLSYSRSDIELFGKSLEPVDSDIMGPVTLGVAVRDVPDAGGEEARLVAVGCPTLLAAQGPQGLFGYMPANFDLFLNALTWLQDRPENISVRSKTVLSSPLTMSAVHVIVFGVIFALVVPLGLFSAGFVVWLRRRHL